MCSVFFVEMRKSLTRTQEKCRTAQKYAERMAQNGQQNAQNGGGEKNQRTQKLSWMTGYLETENRKSDFRNDII
jgi:hypothetical protein